MANDVAALSGGGIAGADGDFGRMECVAVTFGDGLNAHERRAEVAIDVDRERLQWRDIQDPHSPPWQGGAGGGILDAC